jgi:hypothetical protein
MLHVSEFYGFVFFLFILAAASGLALGVLKQTTRLVIVMFRIFRTLPSPIPRKRTRHASRI